MERYWLSGFHTVYAVSTGERQVRCLVDCTSSPNRDEKACSLIPEVRRIICSYRKGIHNSCMWIWASTMVYFVICKAHLFHEQTTRYWLCIVWYTLCRYTVISVSEMQKVSWKCHIHKSGLFLDLTNSCAEQISFTPWKCTTVAAMYGCSRQVVHQQSQRFTC